MAGALGVLMLLALVVIVPSLGGGSADGDRTSLGASPEPPAVSPSAAPTSPAGPVPTSAAPSASPTETVAPGFQLPAGWQMHRDKTGFAVPVPKDWRVTRDRDGRVYFHDPKGGRMLMIDQTDSPKPDPVADWTAQEKQRKHTWPGYERVTIEAVDYWDKAADWEWTYDLKGVRMHVRNRGFITAPDKAYGMYWRTPAAEWEQNLELFEVIEAGFEPARKTVRKGG